MQNLELNALNKPYKIYAENLEDSAMKQFVDVMKLDCVVQGALLPDAHTGYTMPIGGVVAVKDYVFPAFVGYDIGCGMAAIPISGVDLSLLKKKVSEVHHQITRDVPTGKNHHKDDQSWLSDIGLDEFDITDYARKEFDRKALKQLGTLGSGNHFIEVGVDTNDQVWAITHSGSRNFGHTLATHYMRLASGDGHAREGAFGFHVDTQEGIDYIRDLKFALEFALVNRKTILKQAIRAITKIAGGNVDWDQVINRNHNHAELNAEGLWIHRKGATHAEAGMLGVIPGNMRDGSFIVRGKGNPDSMCSSSHGAGRIMSRKQTLETTSMEDFRKTMNESGVYATVTKGTLDESPFAYKNIFDVMRLQDDLVEVITHVKPILNVKSDDERVDWKTKKAMIRKYNGELPCI